MADINLPDTLLVEDGTVTGRSFKRLYRSRIRHLIAWFTCLLHDHDFGEFTIDDLDGPGELLDEDDPDSFMPWTSRPSKPGEFGIRTCRRRCGAMEVRWPVEEMPGAWRDALKRQGWRG